MLRSILPEGLSFTYTATSLFRWVFNAKTHDEIEKELRECYPKTWTQHLNRISKIALTNGYVMRNCKLFAYAHFMAVHNGTEPPEPKAYDIHPDDVMFLRSLDLSHLLKRECLPPVTLKEFDNLILTAVKETKAYTDRFIYKKMLFLINSYAIPHEDISGDMKESAVRAIQRVYPLLECDLHLVNTVKHEIHNEGQTLIQKSTTSGRNRLVQEKDGTFSSLLSPIVSEDALTNVDEEDNRKHWLKVLADVESQMSGKVRRFILCMMGEHDDGFSEYLGGDNSQLVESMSYRAYRRRLETYMNISRNQSEEVFSHIRRLSGM